MGIASRTAAHKLTDWKRLPGLSKVTNLGKRKESELPTLELGALKSGSYDLDLCGGRGSATSRVLSHEPDRGRFI